MAENIDTLTKESFLLNVMNIPSVNNKDTVYSGFFCPENSEFLIMSPSI